MTQRAGARSAATVQDRLPPLPARQLTPLQKAGVAAFIKVRGTPPFGPFVALLRSPEVMVRVGALGEHLRYGSSLPPRLSEFIVLIVARTWSQQYEWLVHESIAIEAGLRPELVKALADGRRPDAMAEDEDVVYSVCDELHRNRTVSDGTYRRAVAALGEQGVIDAVSTAGYYTLLAMVMNTARTALPEGATPPLPPFP